MMNRILLIHRDSYRLGAPGFLSSQELLNAGIKSNNGLRDQRTALAWIRTYIEGFGGDQDNITVAGESAGSGETICRLSNETSLIFNPSSVVPLASRVATTIV
jgi:carboxylesterase type B